MDRVRYLTDPWIGNLLTPLACLFPNHVVRLQKQRWFPTSIGQIDAWETPVHMNQSFGDPDAMTLSAHGQNYATHRFPPWEYAGMQLHTI